MSFGVIFDMDGVMVMSEEAHWESWRRTAAAHGVDLAHETFLACFGRVNDDCIRLMFGDDLDRAAMDQIATEKESAYRDSIASNVPLAAGLVPLLEALRGDGVRMAVGSSAPRENIDLILSAGGIHDYFDAAVDGAQVTTGKPAPDVFLTASRLLDLPPAGCAVIEDAPAGIQAARAAGCLAVAVTTTNTRSDLESAGAHVIVPDVSHLTSALIRTHLEHASRSASG